MKREPAQPASSAGLALKDGMPFFFKRLIRLQERDAQYVEKCIADVRKNLVREQRKGGDRYLRIWDLRNGLTLYLVTLQEIASGRKIRYCAPLNPAVCMAAYLGHTRMLRIMRRNEVAVERAEWCTLNVLFSAILGRRFSLVKSLLAEWPELRLSRNPWFGHAGAFCAGFGNLAILRFLRAAGFDMCEKHRFPSQPSGDIRHLGSAMLVAVRRRRRSIVADLAAHNEFCDWKNLHAPENGSRMSFFAEAVRNDMLDIAETYRANGWHDNVPLSDVEMADLVRNTHADWNVGALRYLERSFKAFDVKRIVRERLANCSSKAVLRYCGMATNRLGAEEESAKRAEAAEDVCNGILHWIDLGMPEMVRFALDEVPEVLPLVWPMAKTGIMDAFCDTGEQCGPCRKYLFRLARSMGMNLFANETVRRFWLGKCECRAPTARQMTPTEEFPYDEGLGGYLIPEEQQERYFRALHSQGSKARMVMDDPTVDPNICIDWNTPFSERLGHYADWKTYRGWLLRGMEIYKDNYDDPGDIPLDVTKSIVPHLLPDLEHRSWVSGPYVGNTLLLAAKQGALGAVKELVAAGCPVNFRRSTSQRSMSPLRAALLNGHDKVARWLYANGGMNILNEVVYLVPDWITRHPANTVKPTSLRG